MRLEAMPPARFEVSGISYLSPVDSEGGGTWIWINTEGVIGCLLNNYAVKKAGPVDPVSRGLLLKSLAGHQHTESLIHAVSTADLRMFKGFLIFTMDRQGHRLVTWDCDTLRIREKSEINRPITSSGYLPEEIVAHRRSLYRSRFATVALPSSDELFCYHTLHDPALPAHSVLMCRPEARTVSLSRIFVEPETVKFSYGTVSEQCRLNDMTTRTLNRVR